MSFLFILSCQVSVISLAPVWHVIGSILWTFSLRIQNFIYGSNPRTQPIKLSNSPI